MCDAGLYPGTVLDEVLTRKFGATTTAVGLSRLTVVRLSIVLFEPSGLIQQQLFCCGGQIALSRACQNGHASIGAQDALQDGMPVQANKTLGHFGGGRDFDQSPQDILVGTWF